MAPSRGSEVSPGQIALRRRDQDSAAQALSRAKATVQPPVASDAEAAGKFSSLHTEKLANGDTRSRKSYLRSIIGVVEIDDKSLPVAGRGSTLRNAISERPAGFANVSGLDREWRAGEGEAENFFHWNATLKRTKASAD